MTPGVPPPSVKALIDHLVKQNDLKNYAALAREMEEHSSVLSNLVRGKRRLSAQQILFIHEYYGMAVQEIRERSGQYD
jgi:plasmid maintenance system antidote protein VapI